MKTQELLKSFVFIHLSYTNGNKKREREGLKFSRFIELA